MCGEVARSLITIAPKKNRVVGSRDTAKYLAKLLVPAGQLKQWNCLPICTLWYASFQSDDPDTMKICFNDSCIVPVIVEELRAPKQTWKPLRLHTSCLESTKSIECTVWLLHAVTICTQSQSMQGDKFAVIMAAWEEVEVNKKYNFNIVSNLKKHHLANI